MNARVRVPATSSNLGAGFDCIGIAVDRWLTASATLRERDSGVTIHRGGQLAALTLPPEEDLLAVGFRAACRAAGVEPVGVAIDATSEIAVGRGLGSSAAAIVAGALLADAALGLGLSRTSIVEIAAEVEGHSDNVAAAVYGGAVLSVRSTGLRSVALAVSPDLVFLLAVPPFPSDTRRARAALPEVLPHAVAVLAASRAAALVQGLATGDRELLAAALNDDVLHVPYRRARIPGYDAVVAAAQAAGAYGATLSGAGSAILAIAPGERAGTVGAALLAAWRGAGVEAELLRFAELAEGATISDAAPTTHYAPRTIHQT